MGQCEVCNIAMDEASQYVKENSIVDEDNMADMLEGLCSVKKKEGRWVSMLDIVREDDDAQLAVVRQETPGFCKSECLLVQRACQAAIKNKEEKLQSMLLKGKRPKELKKDVCKKICAKEPPKLAK